MNTSICNPTALRLCLLLPLAAMVAAGCGAKKDVTGTWTGTMSVKGITANVSQTFKPDGTETFITSIPGVPGMPGGMSMTMNYTYTFANDTITQKLVDGSMSMNGRNTAMPATAGQTQTIPIKLDGDKLTYDTSKIGAASGMAGAPGQLVLTKQK